MIAVSKFPEATSSAYTLEPGNVFGDDFKDGYNDHTCASGWRVLGCVQEDYFTWVNQFVAFHNEFGLVYGDFENVVYATSQEAFDHFFANHTPNSWDYDDI